MNSPSRRCPRIGIASVLVASLALLLMPSRLNAQVAGPLIVRGLEPTTIDGGVEARHLYVVVGISGAGTLNVEGANTRLIAQGPVAFGSSNGNIIIGRGGTGVLNLRGGQLRTGNEGDGLSGEIHVGDSVVQWWDNVRVYNRGVLNVEPLGAVGVTPDDPGGSGGSGGSGTPADPGSGAADHGPHIRTWRLWVGQRGPGELNLGGTAETQSVMLGNYIVTDNGDMVRGDRGVATVSGTQARLEAGEVRVGYGELNIEQNGRVSTDTLLVGSSRPPEGQPINAVRVTGGGAFDVPAARLEVGETTTVTSEGNGLLEIRDGGEFDTGILSNRGQTVVQGAGSRLSVHGFSYEDGTPVEARTTVASFSTIGSLEVLDGAEANTGHTYVSTGNNHQIGTIDVSGAGSTLVAESLTLGRSVLSTNAITTVSDGGTLVVNGDTTIYSSGKLTIGPNGTFINNGTLQALSGAEFTNAGTLSGSGTFNVPVAIGEGQTIAPGNSAGTAAFGNGLFWEGGGAYEWELVNHSGAAGTDWDHIDVTGGLGISATTDNPFLIKILSDLDGDGNPLGDFDATSDHSWTILTADDISGWDLSLLSLQTGGLLHNLHGGVFGLDRQGNSVVVNFTAGTLSQHAVPEPGSLAIWSLALVGLTLVGRSGRLRTARR